MRLLLSFLLLLAGCDEPAAPTSPEAPPAAAPVPDPTPDGPAPPRVANPAVKRMAASHILVAYQGAMGAKPTVTRSKEEARTRAEEVRGKVLAGEDFAALARLYSDDPKAKAGGALGSFEPGAMQKSFEDAVLALPVGGVSPLVETPFGFHVVRRDPMVEIHGAHLVVTWKGADRAPDNVTRTKEEAKARADEARAALDQGTPWADVVRRYSDGALAQDAGDLGWFTRNQLNPALDATAFDLDVGATSPVLESPKGYHILKRLE